MSIGAVRLPTRNSSDYSSSSDIEPPPEPDRPKLPQKTEVEQKDNEDNPFEVGEEYETPSPAKLNLESLGLPPLSFNSDPFLSPINSVQFAVKRHRIWVRGLKGVKFILSISGFTVLVAKRKMKFLKPTWYISRALNYSLDTPDLVGILIKQRTKATFSLFGPNERQSDHCRPVLAGIDIGDKRRVVLGKDLWISPDTDDVFNAGFNEKNSQPLTSSNGTFDVPSVKNAQFSVEGSAEPCFISAKQVDKSVVVNAKGPLSLCQAFSIAISLFMQ
ncbi:hypothetical protein TVAG_035380 [Trichomonas vaginalis G3]|uniref:Tubby C-terminal domain-containing protein n=1 Tax=Trichomonas vaginalis (strain ATCC PRA-98 / G3) TaxID=412133 RepID=A2DAL2_TRIV3|nr:hypothetical protein TVAGG3_0811560 [Trichomonas vaginalis G3]EAY22515.1 hypothetical protein TVAG_035380 [Trichomonas vaginalis G3]KAI5497248.1 hypothetical protein TVAGG3_0811560 [Trichomonas vaginalis G3]|eukprot:XP_001583501.1 hypothetical protein [Trichomonas vaginalis G3]